MLTREELALLLENEARNDAAERVRAGEDVRLVLRSIANAQPRYDDDISRSAVATFEAVASGDLTVIQLAGK